MEARVAERDDVAAIAETFAGAFFDDPVWGWAFGDARRRLVRQAAFWRLLLDGGLDHRWVWTTSQHESASLWIPPGCAELPEPHASRLLPLVTELLGTRGAIVLEVFDRFEQAHPDDVAHFYLSVLATHPDHRGAGIGMALLRANLALIDAAAMPAYLESTNPVNVARYELVGFEVCGAFDLPGDGPRVTTMWREPQQLLV